MLPTDQEIDARLADRLRISKEVCLKEIAREFIIGAIEDAMGCKIRAGNSFISSHFDPFDDEEADYQDIAWLHAPCWTWMMPGTILPLGASFVNEYFAHCLEQCGDTPVSVLYAVESVREPIINLFARIQEEPNING